jgi:hypothetical protein
MAAFFAGATFFAGAFFGDLTGRVSGCSAIDFEDDFFEGDFFAGLAESIDSTTGEAEGASTEAKKTPSGSQDGVFFDSASI